MSYNLHYTHSSATIHGIFIIYFEKERSEWPKSKENENKVYLPLVGCDQVACHLSLV